MRFHSACLLAASLAASLPALGQEARRSVRTGYAQVLRVEPTPPLPPNCEMVPVQREFRRPIAYDVDYVYRGLKYRSRLPYDPGNRLRVQVSIQPYVAPQGTD